MPIGNVSRDSAPKRETFRPPWVKDKDTEALPSWTQKKLKPVESTTKAAAENDAAPSETPKPLKRESKKKKLIRHDGVQICLID